MHPLWVKQIVLAARLDRRIPGLRPIEISFVQPEIAFIAGFISSWRLFPRKILLI